MLEAEIDPNVPPRIALEQARKLASTLVKGDPDEGSLLVSTAREMLSTVLPGSSRSR